MHVPFWATPRSGIVCFCILVYIYLIDNCPRLTSTAISCDCITFPTRRTLCIIQPLLQCISALQLFCAQQGVRDATDSLRFDTQLAARLASAATLSFASPSLIAALTASSEATESVLVDTHASCWFEWLRFAADAESSASVDDLVAAAGAQPEQPTYVHPRADDVSTSNAVASSTDSIIPPLHCNRIPQSDTWALVSDWIPCPIGMMPRSLASPASSSTLMMTMPGAPPPTASFPSAHTRRVNMQQQHPHPHSHNVAPDMQQRADAETATKRRRLDSEHIAVELL